jgi:hypothetical protein
MATTLTDYQILHDGGFELSGNLDTKSGSFTLPSDFTVGTNRAKPVLTFIINCKSSSATVHGSVNNPQLLQSKSDIQLTYTNNKVHLDIGLWEAISGTKFKPGQANTWHFRTVGSASKVVIRDIILWYQRDV